MSAVQVGQRVTVNWLGEVFTGVVTQVDSIGRYPVWVRRDGRTGVKPFTLDEIVEAEQQPLCVDPLGDAARGIATEAVDMLLRKHKAYGPGNIADAPGGPLNGLLVRIHDKVERLKHLHYAEGSENHYESVEDTFLDLLNYALIGLLVQRGQWPGAERYGGKQP